MRILVAGATGALGKQLVPRLVASGHDVVGMTRTPGKQDALRGLGATPVVADALDPEQVARAVAEAEPEAIVHQLTALPGALDMRHFDRTFATTNRLRTEGTDHLLAAGRAAAVERGRRGVYNVVDDEPAAVAEWLPAAAAAFGAKPPWRVPRAVGRLLAGEAATVMMTEVRGASNAKARRELGWQPRHASWREGFAEVSAAA